VFVSALDHARDLRAIAQEEDEGGATGAPKIARLRRLPVAMSPISLKHRASRG